MKLIPLKQWICDSCGGIIENPEDGWLEWYDSKDEVLSNFRIVHQGKSCTYKEQKLREQGILVAELSLERMIGGAGLAHWLFEIELEEKGKVKSKIGDLTELVEILRRLHVPYWEEARLYWDRAFRDGFHDGCDFGKNSLMAIIEEYTGKE
jgi:hypothetical protein